MSEKALCTCKSGKRIVFDLLTLIFKFKKKKKISIIFWRSTNCFSNVNLVFQTAIIQAFEIFPHHNRNIVLQDGVPVDEFGLPQIPAQ